MSPIATNTHTAVAPATCESNVRTSKAANASMRRCMDESARSQLHVNFRTTLHMATRSATARCTMSTRTCRPATPSPLLPRQPGSLQGRRGGRLRRKGERAGMGHGRWGSCYNERDCRTDHKMNDTPQQETRTRPSPPEHVCQSGPRSSHPSLAIPHPAHRPCIHAHGSKLHRTAHSSRMFVPLFFAPNNECVCVCVCDCTLPAPHAAKRGGESGAQHTSLRTPSPG